MNKNEWNDEELMASVAAYIDMLHKHQSGIPFIKKHYYADLKEKYGRTEKSFEYRMQNISHVLFLMGRPWIPGLKPARNVGANIAKRIETMIRKMK